MAADLQDEAAKDRLRGLIFGTISAATNPEVQAEGRPTLDGTPFAMREGGKDWVVRVGVSRGAGTCPDSPHMVKDAVVHRA